MHGGLVWEDVEWEKIFPVHMSTHRHVFIYFFYRLTGFHAYVHIYPSMPISLYWYISKCQHLIYLHKYIPNFLPIYMSTCLHA